MGSLCSKPLPRHINVEKVVEAIRPEKDVDGFHPINIGRLAKNLPLLRRRHSFWYHAVAGAVQRTYRRQALRSDRKKRYCGHPHELTAEP